LLVLASPRFEHLSEFAAVQSLVCPGVPVYLDSTAPASTSSFPRDPAVLRRCRHPPRVTATESSSRRLRAPSETVRLSLPGRARQAPSMGSHTSSRHQDRSPLPASFPRPTYVPPSAFLTPSTVSSSAHLAGLFHPAATSRVHSSGVSSSRTAPRARHPKLPSCRLQRLPAASFIQWLQDPPPAFRAFLHPRVRGAQWWFRPPPARSPPELQPPSGSPSRTVRATFTALSDLGLSRPSSFRPCATCLALASPTSPFEVPARLRFKAALCQKDNS
jgi:hypothetical protein